MLLGLHAGPVGGVVAAGLAAGVLLAGLRGRRAVVVAAAGCALAAGMVVTAHAVALHGHPLRAAADRGAAATLDVVVRDDPRELRPSTAGGRPGATQVLVPATLRAAEAGGGRWSGGGRVLLIAPAEEWSALLPGQPVTADGLLAPADARRPHGRRAAGARPARGPSGSRRGGRTAAGGLRDGLRERRGASCPGRGRAAAGPRRRRHPRPADGGRATTSGRPA